jgi:hypothetical protein
MLVAMGLFLILALSEVTMSDTTAESSTSGKHPRKEYTYTITTVTRLLPPARLSDMNDDYQDARLISKEGDLQTVEITYYPISKQGEDIGENAKWRAEDACMTEYLKPRPAANWDSKMRDDLLAELKKDGIDPDHLTDKALVQKVSRWLMRRCTYTDKFTSWFVYYPNGHPEVYPPLRADFDASKPDAKWPDEKMFGEEVLGKEMFYNKVHGACTSTALLMATVLRALGIPTRIVVFVPAADPNDSGQLRLLCKAVHHNVTRSVVQRGLQGQSGFDDHMFNEVFINHHWVRLNYTNLGQGIVDKNYLGLMTHIYTCLDLSDIPLAQTWGMRFARKSYLSPSLSSVNPYMLVSARDEFGKLSHVENPPAPESELRTVTIDKLYLPSAPEMAGANVKFDEVDLLAHTVEWIPDQDWRQLRLFQDRASKTFVLRSPGHPDVSVQVIGNITCDVPNDELHDGRFRGFGLKIADGDRKKIVPGADYTLLPIGNDGHYQWKVTDNVVIKMDSLP